MDKFKEVAAGQHLRVRLQQARDAEQQVLVDPAMHNDWMVELEVDLAASREANQPVLRLLGLGPIG